MVTRAECTRGGDSAELRRATRRDPRPRVPPAAPSRGQAQDPAPRLWPLGFGPYGLAVRQRFATLCAISAPSRPAGPAIAAASSDDDPVIIK